MIPSTVVTAMREKQSGVARAIALSAIFVIILTAPLFAIDPHQPLAQLYHTSWSAKQGLNGSVTALAQTTDGYLWVGTTDGLFRFDGISFEQVPVGPGSLLGRQISTLMAVPDGGLWVGFMRGGASFLKDNQVSNYSEPDGLPVSAVRRFARDPSGVIWAAVVGGFARLEGQHWRKIGREWNYSSKTAMCLLVDREGTLWVATGTDIVFLPNGKKQFQDTGIRVGNVYFMTQAPDGRILVNDGFTNVRVFRRDANNKTELLPSIEISLRAAIFDRDGGLWMGDSKGGVRRVSFPDKLQASGLKATSEVFTEADGLSQQFVDAILEDREGNIWVGTDGGLDRFRLRNVEWFRLQAGPFSLAAGPGNDVWAGSGGGAPLLQLGGQNSAERRITHVYTVYHDPDNSIWYGANSSLLHFKNGKLFSLAVPHQVLELSRSVTPPDPIIASAITKDLSGTLWVAFGGSGEFLLKEGVWTFIPILPDHPDWSARYAFTDKSDRVWLCWGDRIARYDHGKVQVFGLKEGLAIGAAQVIAESEQNIWVGGESGLAFLQGGRFHPVRVKAGANFTGITGIVAVHNGGIWLSTNPGVVHVPEIEVANVVRNPEHVIAFELFDLISDLPEPLQSDPSSYASTAIQANDGAMWFATQNGAVRVDSAHIYRNPLSPPVLIRSVVADGKNYSPFSHLVFPALTKNLRISYIALSLSIPERVRFRYKLEGWDNTWHEAESNREAVFTNLAPTKYKFRVAACNNDGVWNETGASLEFSVLPAFYQANWFRALCVAVFLALLWAFYQFRLNQLQERFNAGLEGRVNERVRIARELHDTLLQSLHGLLFRFQAARNMLPRRTDEAMEALDGAISRTEQAITESQDAITDLRPGTTTESDLGEQVRACGKELETAANTNGTPSNFSLTVEGERKTLSPILQEEIFRIARELLRNAFRHACAHRVEAEVRYDDEQLRVRIRDDGKGMDPEVLRQGNRQGHWGLPGAKERAKQIGGRLDIWSEARAGTEIQLSVPASIAYENSHDRPRFRFLRRVRVDEQRF